MNFMTNKPNFQFHQIPLTLGITGHRDLREEDQEILRQSARKIFQFLHQHYPNTPLQLFSPLAEGADRLVAQVALEEKVQLIVPLPMPRALYETDFQTSESKTEFTNLLDQATQVFELSFLEGNTVEILQTDENARIKQYAFLGAYIARHTHILIALWDGLPSEQSGGTCQVKDFKLTGNMKDLPAHYQPQQSPLDVPDTGIVCHIVTSRQSGEPLNLVGEIRILLPSGQEAEQLQALSTDELTALDRFNQDVRKHSICPYPQRSIINGQKYLLPERLWQNLFNLSPAFQTMVGVYSTANTLARHFKSRLKFSTTAVLWIAIGMVSLYGWYTSIETHLTTLTGYFVLFLCALGILQINNWRHYHSKNLDYRALAEGLRVQIFWHLGGLTDSVADHYLRKQQGELTWVRNSIRALNVYDWVENTEDISVVHSRWLKNQHDWFVKNAQKNHRQANIYQRWVTRLFVLSVFFIISMLIGHLTGIIEPNTLWHKILILLIALTPASGALLHHHAEKMAYDEHAKQYERMANLFAKANKAIETIIIEQHQAKDDPIKRATYQQQAKQILFELGKEALEENGDWVLLHRKKPLELP